MTLGILVEYNSTYIGVRVYSKIVKKKKKKKESKLACDTIGKEEVSLYDYEVARH